MLQIGPGIDIGPGISFGEVTGNIAPPGPVLSNLVLYWDPNDTASYNPAVDVFTIDDLSLTGQTGSVNPIDPITGDYSYPGFEFSQAQSISGFGFPQTVPLQANGAGFQFQTVEVWARPGFGTLVTSGGQGGESILSVVANTTVYASAYDGYGDAPNLASISGTVSSGSWAQLVMTYSGADSPYSYPGSGPVANPPVSAAGNLCLYVNGVLANSVILVNGRGYWQNAYPFNVPFEPSDGGSGSINFADGSLTSGPLPATSWEGGLGLMRFYDRTLSDAEVLQNFESDRGTYGV